MRIILITYCLINFGLFHSLAQNDNEVIADSLYKEGIDLLQKKPQKSIKSLKAAAQIYGKESMIDEQAECYKCPDVFRQSDAFIQS